MELGLARTIEGTRIIKCPKLRRVEVISALFTQHRTAVLSIRQESVSNSVKLLFTVLSCFLVQSSLIHVLGNSEAMDPGVHFVYFILRGYP
ncbi:MAG: hypothetical protein K0S36_1644 [Nitrosospira multiformis]|nr:hypothetical protein [Nitrosospira multiformis]